MLKNLEHIISSIIAVDKSLLNKAKEHLDILTKPVGSLGRLEELAQHIYAINGGQMPLSVDPAIMFTIAGDHGVAEENVSAFPQCVTRQMVENFLNNGAAINVLCKECHMSLQVVDAGCVGGEFKAHSMLISASLGEGTANITKKAAMSKDICIKGLLKGIELVKSANIDGKKCVGIGEMGIANTTSATALFCAYLNLDPQLVTGQGTGLSPEQVKHKINIIKKSLELHKKCLREDDAISILATLGGFEIVIMAGIILGAAKYKIPVLIDGFISTSAYVAARAICPTVSDYCILTHYSAESGYKLIIDTLNISRPLLDLQMRLGEGTGAALAFSIVRASAAIFNDMATFEQAKINT